jgi:Oxidoreductase molybdopterin binding domain
MSPRAVDWSLAFCVWVLFATGVLSLYVSRPGEAWVFVAHGALGFALVAVLAFKVRRVWSRIVDSASWDERTGIGLASLAVVLAALASGFVWSVLGWELAVVDYNLLGWHMVFGTLLVVVVLGHALVRRKPLRVRRDVVAPGRRQFLVAGGVAAGAFAAWQLQKPFATVAGLRGAKRRFTGSYELGSFGGGDAFPPTSWVADAPAPVGGPLVVSGLVESELSLDVASLRVDDELEALLDCTSGWYTRQRWRGVRLDRVLARAGVRASARNVVVRSHTGYRWSFPLEEAPRLLLATHVGGEQLSHGHGAPCRLVAPGRRGFQWVKWVTRIELTDAPDIGAPASTVWSSATAAGRGTDS